MLYLIILIYNIFLVILYDINNSKLGRHCNYFILLIVYILTAGFSYRLGVDSIRYEYMFENIHSLAESNISATYLVKNYNQYDSLWLLFNSICKIIINDFWLVKLLTALFVNSTIFWFCKKHSPAPFLTILFYYIFQYWNFNFEILRESISISFFLIALNNIIGGKNNIIRYYIIVIPAIFFHSFGFITLFLPIIKNLRPDINIKKYILIVSIITPFLMLISGYIMQFDIWGDNISRKMNDIYLYDSNYGSDVLNIYGIIHQILIICCSIYILKKTIMNYQFSAYGYAYSFVSIMIMGFAIFYRINNYLSIPFFICLTYFCIQTLKYRLNEKKRILVFMLFIILTLQPKFSYNLYRRYTPYSSIFSKDINLQRERVFDKYM